MPEEIYKAVQDLFKMVDHSNDDELSEFLQFLAAHMGAAAAYIGSQPGPVEEELFQELVMCMRNGADKGRELLRKSAFRVLQ
ncbi:hypothetical protein COLU111180_12100 [Cohnella lubricantis]|uniref:Uncharacterized protein n=1 Tax=Cohnella lubricantis TaxID=2163172 RepID=A0A841T950_9BACL|nr:hypothetical protein [Cohnella lubricantis]MBB6675958.1 hypothetical protein [Cohnella lubricantis]MBP2117925.1 hypothetical protein [Cohnella lubricantis]